MIKIFIAHYSKLVERKQYMIEQFKKHRITNYEFVEKYDKECLTDKDKEIFTYDPQVSMSAVSLALKKLYIFKQIRDFYDYALILEDDAVLCDNFMDTLQKYMTELPNTYDMLFLGCGLGFHIEPNLILPNKHIYKKCLYPTPWGGDGCTRGTDCYLMTKECAKKLCWYVYEKQVKPRAYIDFILNQAGRDMNLEVYWSEPTLAVQGSVTGLFNSSVVNGKKTWVFALFCDETTVNKAFQTIVDARRVGEWTADIVLIVNEVLFKHPEVNEFAKVLHVILREVPSTSQNVNAKFHIFDSFFKRWDAVLYMDASSQITKPLSPVEPNECLYAKVQSNTLTTLFDFNKVSSIEKFQMLYKYNMMAKYFTSNIIIYDTKILQEETSKYLSELADRYSNYIDINGILNLYFMCERNCWKELI